jgi:hypothetical protein
MLTAMPQAGLYRDQELRIGKDVMRRLIGVAVLLSVVSSGHLLAQTTGRGSGEKTAAGPPAEPSLPQKILNLETKRIAAMVAKDIPALDALLADDLSYTHSGGTTDTKASFLTLIKEKGRYLGIDYLKTQVSAWGESTAIVRGLAQIRLEGTPGYSVLFLDVWAIRNGTWKMVAWQATRVPE